VVVIGRKGAPYDRAGGGKVDRERGASWVIWVKKAPEAPTAVAAKHRYGIIRE
jgi:hypothetical protein